MKLYEELAGWYTLLTSPDDYEEEATWYAKIMREHVQRDLKTMLELGCGSGANASYMKAWFELVLVDLSEAMLREAKKLNPELPQHQGDMRTFRIDQRFDAVFVHDAASYLLTEADLRAAAETAAVHLESGGVALFCPDDTAENFKPGIESGGNDGADGRAVRYLDWSTAGPGHTVITDYAYMLRDRDGVRVEHDRHVTGRLPEATWLAALRDAGLSPKTIELVHPDIEPGRHHVFVAVKS